MLAFFEAAITLARQDEEGMQPVGLLYQESHGVTSSASVTPVWQPESASLAKANIDLKKSQSDEHPNVSQRSGNLALRDGSKRLRMVHSFFRMWAHTIPSHLG